MLKRMLSYSWYIFQSIYLVCYCYWFRWILQTLRDLELLQMNYIKCYRFVVCTYQNFINFFFKEEELKDATLLIFANKQDLPGALPEAQVRYSIALCSSSLFQFFVLVKSCNFQS